MSCMQTETREKRGDKAVEELRELLRAVKKVITAVREERREERREEGGSDAAEGGESRVEDLLRAIWELREEVSVDFLEESKIAITMKSLRKVYPQNTAIMSMSKSLVHSWKTMYRAQSKGNEGSSDEEKVNKEVKAKNVKKVFTGQDEILLKRCMKFNTYTITFGDQAENHVGMQKIGSLSDEGFSLQDLLQAQEWFSERGIQCELIALHENLLPPDVVVDEAYVLVARDGVTACAKEVGIKDEEDFRKEVFREQVHLNPDKRAFMYGRVVNKHARYNLCFGNFNQKADYENGKGTVVSFENVPSLQVVRNMLPSIIGDKAENLEAEGNYYYDLSKCGIGYHGDAERMKVVALRLGATMDLCYAWFQNSVPISQRKVITLNHGDMYFMSQKATGQDWRKKVIPTLRHAAGSRKFTDLPKPK